MNNVKFFLGYQYFIQDQINKFLHTPLFPGDEDGSGIYPELLCANVVVLSLPGSRMFDNEQPYLHVTIFYK